jgi:hypothetical protein
MTDAIPMETALRLCAEIRQDSSGKWNRLVHVQCWAARAMQKETLTRCVSVTTQIVVAAAWSINAMSNGLGIDPESGTVSVFSLKPILALPANHLRTTRRAVLPS